MSFPFEIRNFFGDVYDLKSSMIRYIIIQICMKNVSKIIQFNGVLFVENKVSTQEQNWIPWVQKACKNKGKVISIGAFCFLTF